ncbi:hypothetical protein [Rhodospirillum centenum]|uniref:AbiU2 domain-containing protein n=1 Tax=Rhodospirillum centenum TaxID=34018 RepID=UPI0011D17B99|nr:hypothetical protein [Rhodospirillum centenum]
MSHIRTSDEIKADYVETMGNDLGVFFHAIFQEVSGLYKEWIEYVEIFGANEDRINIINSICPNFFGIIQKRLWESLTLHVARLTDPPHQRGKNNLTILALPSLVESSIQERVQVSVDEAVSHAGFCRDWRNRHIAHRDLELTLERSAEPLKPASRELMRRALDSISKSVNTVHEHYFHCEIGFQYQPAESYSLICTLDDAIHFREDIENRIRSGDKKLLTPKKRKF